MKSIPINAINNHFHKNVYKIKIHTRLYIKLSDWCVSNKKNTSKCGLNVAWQQNVWLMLEVSIYAVIKTVLLISRRESTVIKYKHLSNHYLKVPHSSVVTKKNPQNCEKATALKSQSNSIEIQLQLWQVLRWTF